MSIMNNLPKFVSFNENKIMRNLVFTLFTFVFLLITLFSFAQTPPQAINYQAIARDTAGKAISSSMDLAVKFTIWSAPSGGSSLFSETHSPVNTNSYGLFTLVIGTVNTSGFQSIIWPAGDKFLEVEIATVGGNSYYSMGRTQLMSVPYALHSGTSDLALGNWSLNGNTIADTNFIGTKNAKDFVLKTNNTEQMRVKSAGNVGIGNTNPNGRLDVKGSDSTSATYGFGVRNSADDYALIVRDDGNVGVGTTTPSSLLSVGATSQFTVNDTGNIASATGINSSGAINFSGLSSDGIVRTTGGTGTLSSSGGPINLASEVIDTLPVANGGTGLGSLGNWQAFYSDGLGIFTPFSLGAAGTVFQSNGAASTPSWVTPSSLMQNLSNGTGISPFTYNGSSTGLVSIANTGITAGTYNISMVGQTITIPTFTVNAQGQLTAENNSTVNVEAPLTFDNGLTRLANNVRLGGTLTALTVITGNTFNTIFDLNNTGSFSINKNGGTSAFFVNPNDGNVGIGTVTPGAKLDIAGQVMITGGAPGTGKVLTSDAAGLATWEMPDTGTVYSFSAGALSPLFTTSVVTPTTTPALSFNFSNAGAYTVWGNVTGSFATPAYFTPLLNGPLFQNQGTTTQVLHGNAGGNPSWGQIVNADITNATIDLTTKVTGVLPIAKGGTNIALMGVPGSVFYSNGTQHASTTVGTAGQVLTSAGAGTPTWSTPSTGSVSSVATGTGLTGGTITTTGTLSLDYSSTLAGNPGLAANQSVFGATGLIFEGATANTSEGLLTPANPTADRTWTLPDASGTIALLSTGAALTKTDDANVTLTLGGASATSLLNAASLTLGWTGQLSIARGGTNGNAAPTAGGLSYGTGTAFAFTAAGTSGQILKSNGAAAPTWTTPAAGTVTSVATGTGLTGGAITSTGTLSLDYSSTQTGDLALAAGQSVFGTTGLIFEGLTADNFEGLLFTDPTVDRSWKLPDASGTIALTSDIAGIAWSLTGNTGTSSATNFMGTTDNVSLRFRTNNSEKMIIDSLGNVGIGTVAPASNARLAINDGHLQSQQTVPPTIGPVATYASGSQSLSNATDVAGNITILTTAAAGSVTILFDKSYSVAPLVILTATNEASASDFEKVWVTTTLSSFTINFNNIGGFFPPIASVHTYSYHVIETQ